MLSVVVAWVFFRAITFPAALGILKAMVCGTEPATVAPLMWNTGLQLSTGLGWYVALATIAVFPVNCNRIVEYLLQACHSRIVVRGLLMGSMLVAVASLVLINTARDSSIAFIYFNF